MTHTVAHAAMSDNAQPLAILAVEKFGAIIDISQKPFRLKENSVLRTPPLATLKLSEMWQSILDMIYRLSLPFKGESWLALTNQAIDSSLYPF